MTTWEFDELLLDLSKSSGLSISPCELIETFSCSSSSDILTSSILNSGDPFDYDDLRDLDFDRLECELTSS